MKPIITHFMFQMPTLGISFNGLQSEFANWVSALVAMILMFMVGKHFFKGSIGQIIVSVIVGAFVYFIVKDPTKALNSISGIFSSLLN